MKRLAATRLRRSLAALLILLLLSFQLGWHVSVNSRAIRTAASGGQAERYPCENSPCGCDSAQRCWRSCCCHTAAEKLAWAKRNGVRPPEYVVAAASEEQTSDSCCAVQVASCCSSGNEETSSCGSAAKSCCEPTTKPSNSKPTQASQHTKFVLGWNALKCRGVSVDIFAGLGIVNTAPKLPVLTEPHPSATVCVLDRSLESTSIAPPLPPPRV